MIAFNIVMFLAANILAWVAIFRPEMNTNPLILVFLGMIFLKDLK